MGTQRSEKADKVPIFTLSGDHQMGYARGNRIISGAVIVTQRSADTDKLPTALSGHPQRRQMDSPDYLVTDRIPLSDGLSVVHVDVTREDRHRIEVVPTSTSRSPRCWPNSMAEESS